MTTAKPTLFAARGLEFVAAFQVKFMMLDVGGHRPHLKEPPGHSTAGGKLATQHIVLEPVIPGATTWTVGSINVATQSAKVRTYDCMRELHRMRFRDRPFPIDREPYQGFFDAAVAFMKERGMAVEIESSLPALSPGEPGALASPESGVSVSPGALAATVALVVIVTAIVAFLLLRS
jgi:hypothetical protein